MGPGPCGGVERFQVVYALALDRQCAFRGEAPVQVYWQMRERGERETEAVLDVEQPIIGLGPQTITERRADGGRVSASIRALPGRPITFTARRSADGCEALATTVIDGREATLQHVYARVWLFGVISVDLEGQVGGRAVTERLR